MNPDHPMAGRAEYEPALSENFSARVIERVRVERRRRKSRRRVAFAALAVVGAVAFLSMRSVELTRSLPQSRAQVVSATAGYELDAAQTLSGYFFPDASSIESYGAAYHDDAQPSLGRALGFDQGTVLPAGVTESDDF